METSSRPCPSCGQPITSGTIICPFCSATVVQADTAWSPPPVDRRGKTPQAKRRGAKIGAGLALANLAAAGLIGLGFWLNTVNGGLASILISSDFLLVPLVMGLTTAYLWRDLGLTLMEYFAFAALNSVLGIVTAGLFMAEGVICLMIVSPLVIGLVFGGTLIGRWLFGLGRSRLNLSLIPLALACLTLDALSPHHSPHVVSDRVVIHAPPAEVWRHLAVVPPIPARPAFWLFRMGLPYPAEATANGQGVGAARRCVFSQGHVFEETITAWEPGRKLTFDVTRQPRDPEILGHARVKRGQFDLIDNRNGTTTLVGTSWYELYVYPSWYYDLWASKIARQVHLRVMDHIKTLSETKSQSETKDRGAA